LLFIYLAFFIGALGLLTLLAMKSGFKSDSLQNPGWVHPATRGWCPTFLSLLRVLCVSAVNIFPRKSSRFSGKIQRLFGNQIRMNLLKNSARFVDQDCTTKNARFGPFLRLAMGHKIQ
jgi:hypothetical protein